MWLDGQTRLGVRNLSVLMRILEAHAVGIFNDIPTQCMFSFSLFSSLPPAALSGRKLVALAFGDAGPENASFS